MTSSALIIWEYLTVLSSKNDPATSTARTELFCMLYNACRDEDNTASDQQVDLSLGRFLKCCSRLATRDVHTHLIGREQSHNTNDEDADGTVLIDTPMGRLHVVAHCFRVIMHELLLLKSSSDEENKIHAFSRNNQESFLTANQRQKLNKVRVAFSQDIRSLQHGTEEVHLNWGKFWKLCETSFMCLVGSDLEEEIEEEEDGGALIAKFIFPHLLEPGNEVFNRARPTTCFEEEKQEQQQQQRRQQEQKRATKPVNLIPQRPTHLPPSIPVAATTTDNNLTTDTAAAVDNKIAHLEEIIKMKDLEMAMLKAQVVELGSSKWRRNINSNDLQSQSAKQERARLCSVSLSPEEVNTNIASGASKNDNANGNANANGNESGDGGGLYGLVDNMIRTDNKTLREALSCLQSEVGEREALLRDMLDNVQYKCRLMQNKLGAIYGPSLLTTIEQNCTLQAREARLVGDTVEAMNSNDDGTGGTGGIGSGSVYGTSKWLVQSITNNLSFSSIIPDMARWDKWLVQSNIAASTLLNASTSSASSPLLWEPMKFKYKKNTDPLHLLVQEVIDKVQLRCPFSLRIKFLTSKRHQHNDGSCYIYADRKLRIRLDRGVPTIMFSSRTEVLEEYLLNCYHPFLSMPQEVLQLRKEMLADAQQSTTKPPQDEGRVEEEDDNYGDGGGEDSYASVSSLYNSKNSNHSNYSNHGNHGNQKNTTPPTAIASPVTDEKLEKIRKKFKAAAYAKGGINWNKLFDHYDRDNSGALSLDEFRRAVRKDG